MAVTGLRLAFDLLEVYRVEGFLQLVVKSVCWVEAGLPILGLDHLRGVYFGWVVEVDVACA